MKPDCATAMLAPQLKEPEQPSVLVIGDLSHPEMALILPSLEGCCRWYCSREPATAVTVVTEMDVPPDLMVFVQSRPGEISHALVNRLRSIAPVSGLCAVLGSQCEGETRTGQPLVGTPRVFWHQWPAFWREQRSRLRRGLLPAWTLPATASDEERLLQSSRHAPHAVADAQPAQVVVISKASESASALADAVRAAGHSAAIWNANAGAPSPVADVVLWDAPPEMLCDHRQAQAIQRQFPDASLIGIVTFPRFQDRAAALSAGLDTIVAKPFRLEHLLDEIERVLMARTP